jgi:hypothetical protein
LNKREINNDNNKMAKPEIIEAHRKGILFSKEIKLVKVE